MDVFNINEEKLKFKVIVGIAPNSNQHGVYRFNLPPITDICNSNEYNHSNINQMAGFGFSYLLNEICFVDEKIAHRNLYMSSETITALAAEGSVGSHAHDHLPLGVLPEESAKYQIGKSKEVLERLGIESRAFSYPYGSKEAVGHASSYLSDYGFTFAFTMNRGVNINFDNAFELNRYDNNDVPGGKAYKRTHPLTHFE